MEKDFSKKLDLEGLVHLSTKPDVFEYISDDRIDEIGDFCKQGYEIDLASLDPWLKRLKEIRKFTEDITTPKMTPWPNASNVRYPLIVSSAWQFNARAYPAIINMGTPVLAKVIGRDDEKSSKQMRADRISQHMSWQLTEEMSEWEEDMDRLLLILPIDGCAFKKCYFDEGLKRSVSELIICDNLIVNYNTTDLKTCPRISQRFSLYPHEILKRVNNETFRDADYELEEEDESNMKPINFIEQHTYIDMDGDGYPEPYIVTFTEKEGTVARITANFEEGDIEADKEGFVIGIDPTDYFVKYECFPDPTGCFYGKGFGALLLPLNDSVDSILNLLIDAGHLANTGGGFIANSFRLDSGNLKFSPGKWAKVDTAGFPMKDAIMPLPVPDPSPVLFELLGTLIESAKEIGSTQDVMTGGAPGANTPATTTLAIIEQGMKVYTAIFKRIYRGFQGELDLLFILNSTNINEDSYHAVLDTLPGEEEYTMEQDYSLDDLDVAPAADPASATDIQKAAKAQILLQFYQAPTANSELIQTDALRAGGIAQPEKYLMPPPEGPSPEEKEAMEKLRIEEINAESKRLEAVAQAYDSAASALKKMAEIDEIGGVSGPSWADLSLLMTELVRTAQNDTVQEQQGVPPMAGPEPMAMAANGAASGGSAGSSQELLQPGASVPS